MNKDLDQNQELSEEGVLVNIFNEDMYNELLEEYDFDIEHMESEGLSEEDIAQLKEDGIYE